MAGSKTFNTGTKEERNKAYSFLKKKLKTSSAWMESYKIRGKPKAVVYWLKGKRSSYKGILKKMAKRKAQRSRKKENIFDGLRKGKLKVRIKKSGLLKKW